MCNDNDIYDVVIHSNIVYQNLSNIRIKSLNYDYSSGNEKKMITL